MNCPKCGSPDLIESNDSSCTALCTDCGYSGNQGSFKIAIVNEVTPEMLQKQADQALLNTGNALKYLCAELIKAGVPANEVHIFQEATPAGIRLWVDRKQSENKNGG